MVQRFTYIRIPWRVLSRFRRNMLLTMWLAFSTILVLGCAEEHSSSENALTLLHQKRAQEFGLCERTSTTRAAGLVSESRCLIFERPENPDRPDERQIPLRVMVIPALKANPLLDPLVILAGGPGQAATEMASLGLIFNKIRQDRDILLLDQRGTGELSRLQCPSNQDQLEDFSLENLLAVQSEQLNNCLNTIDASPEYYTTDIAITDLEALRQYLGYRQFNLWGASYGTRVALAFLQAYPNSVRTTVLDGVAPTAITLPLYIERDASRALDKIFVACEEEEPCARHYPNLRQHFLELGARFRTQQTLSISDPTTGETMPIVVDVDWLHASLRAPLYGRATQRLVPYIIKQAHQGNYAPLLSVSAIDGGINEGMFLSVVCNEDAAKIDPAAMQREQSERYTLKSRQLSIPIIEACKQWPTRELPESYFEPVNSDLPVLIFSGSTDPVTPPIWGDSVLPGLSNASHIVVEGFAHNTLGTRCTVDIISNFIESAELSEIDTSCLKDIKRRPFFIGTGGRADD